MSEYRSWEDVLDGEPDVAPDAAPLSRDALPEPFQAFLREHERLRQELDRRTGAAQPTPEEARLAAMFPVMVHTPQTRIEARRLRDHDESQMLLKRQALVRRRMAEAEAIRQAEARALAERERERRLRLFAAWENRRAEQQQEAAERRRAEQIVHSVLDDRLAGALEKRNKTAAPTTAAEWERRRDGARQQRQAAEREAVQRDGARQRRQAAEREALRRPKRGRM